jgi:RNA polymerase sigma-70 factor (ECF subfamily)
VAEPKPVEDKVLVARAKRDPEAFGELYERYAQKIYAYLYYRTGDTHDAEELTARVFHRALSHIAQYHDRGLPFAAWLYRIAHNLLLNWRRDEKRRETVPLPETVLSEVVADAPELMAELRQEREVLWQAFRQLPDERQQLLIFKFVERLSNAEIGAILNRSEGAIKSLYHRTLLTLREDIEKDGRLADNGHADLSE